ncbi:MAG: hypothetical protein ACLPTJ_13060 [Solirubrobacteraceae bacterium]
MTTNSQPERSAATGIISDPVDVYGDDVRTPATEQRDDPKPERRNPLQLAVARVMSALRGDKCMVDTHPAVEREDVAAWDDAAQTGER